MKLASSSIRWTGVLVLVAIGVGIFAYGAGRGDSSAKLSYHVSLWNDMAPQIERSLIENGPQKPADLERVYGMMLPHHIPATIPRLVRFYSRLKETQEVKNFIVIGPDHNDSGKAPVTVSNASFFTVYGEIEPIPGIPEELSSAGIASIEEAPFDLEHSIGAQVLVISRIFPQARVTPIILRSNVSREHAESLGRAISKYLDEDTVLVSSVDFSHYLGTDQAMPIDERSGAVLEALDLDSVSLVNADSGMSVAVFMRALLEKGATGTDGFEVLNTNDFMQNADYTTGYVFGFWGQSR